MVTANIGGKLTYEDYRNLPDDMRCEILDGELIMAAAARRAHKRAESNLATDMTNFVRMNDLGEIYLAPDVILSDRDIVQPDIVFLSRARLDIFNELNIVGAPDLVVEILSLSTRARDLRQKRDLYERSGVREYWIVDADEKTLTVLALNGGRYREIGVYREGEVLESPALGGGFALTLE